METGNDQIRMMAALSDNGTSSWSGFILFAAILSLIFSVWVLLDCIDNEPDEGNTKVLWTVIISTNGFIGAILYVLLRRPKRPPRDRKT